MRLRRPLVLVPLAAAALVGASLLALHTPWARARILSSVLGRIAPDGSIRARELDYNLLALRFELRGIEMLSPGHPTPFFTARRIEIRLPWRWPGDTIAIRELTLDGPVVDVRVAADGTSNFAGESTRIDQPVTVGRLEVNDLGVRWADEGADLAFDSGDLGLRLGDATGGLGPLTHPRPARLRAGERDLSFRIDEGSIGWDGRSARIEGLTVASDPARATIDGRIDNALAEPAVELQMSGELDLGAAGTIAGLDTAGTVTATGTLSVDGGGVEARADASASVVRYGDFSARDVAVQLQSNEALEATATWGGLGMRVDGRPAEELPARGRVEARLVGDTWTATIDASTEGLPSVATDMGVTLVSASFRGEAAGTLDSWGVSGAVGVEGLRIRGSRRIDVRGQVAAAPDALHVTEIDGRAGDTRLTGSTRVGREGGLAGRLRLRDLAGEEILRALPAGTVPEGFVERAGLLGAVVSLGGTIERPTGRATITLIDAALRGGVPVTASLDATGSLDAVEIQQGAIELAESALTLRGRATTGGTGSATIATERLAIEPLLSLIPGDLINEAMMPRGGDLAFDVEIDLGPAGAALQGSVAAAGLRIGAAAPIDGEIRMGSQAGTTRIESMSVRAGDSTLSGSGIVTPAAGRADLLIVADLRDLVALTGDARLDGVTSIRADFGLQVDTTNGILGVDLWELEGDVFDAAVRSDDVGWFQWGPTGLEVEQLRLRAGATTIHAAGSLGIDVPRDGIEIAVNGDVGDAFGLLRVAAQRGGLEALRLPEATGTVQVDLRIDGTLAAPEPSGVVHVRDGSAEVASLGTVAGIEVDLVVDRSRARLRNASASLGTATLTASGDLPLALLPLPSDVALGTPGGGGATLEVRLRGFDQSLLEPWVEPARLDGVTLGAEATLELTAAELTLEAIRGSIRLDDLAASARGIEVVEAEPTVIEIDRGIARVRGWRWEIRHAAPGRPTGLLRVTGETGLSLESELDLDATLEIDLAPFTRLLDGAAVAGRALGRLHLGGTPAAPLPTGRIELESVAYRQPLPRVAIEGLQGTIEIEGTRLSASGLEGTINGGEAIAFLELDVADPAMPSGLAGVVARSVAFEAGGARASADLDLSLSARPGEDLRVFGSVTLREGGYRARRSLAGELQRALASTAISPVAGEPSLRDRIRLDIRILGAEGLIVDTPFAELAATTDLQLLGTAARPGLVGRVELLDGGRIYLTGNAYSVERGVLEFADPSRIAPRIDLSASTRISRYDVRIDLQGDAFAPTVAATSEPALAEASVLSLMATGRTLEDAGSQSNQILREQAFGVLTGQLGGVTRALGIDSVRLERGELQGDNPVERTDETDLFPRSTDLSSRVTFTRRFGPIFELALSQNLEGAGRQSWVGTVQLPRQLSIRAGTFDDDSRSVELRQELVFGGAPTVASRARARVARVELTGDMILDPDVLRAELSLEPGDRFDFLAWQRDQERLLRLHHEAGHLTARVRARREADGGDPRTATSLTLAYRITPGPRTRLEVTGYELDESALESMRAAWTDSLAMEFLLEDLAGIARAALVRAGHPDAAVDATLERADGVDTIRLRIEPGPRARGARLAFEGNRAIGAARLRQRLRAEGLADTAWFDPAPTLRALEALYREEGYLGASVTMGTRVTDRDRAVLPLIVDEGPAYTVGAVRVSGSQAIDAGELIAASGIVPGDRFTPAGVDAAASDVVGAYLDRGYNEASVAWRPEVDAEAGSVRVVLSVVEGPLHVLDGIDVAGRRHTSQRLIDRAIRVVPGDPIGLRHVEQLRRRLYETGAFRSVAARLDAAGEPSNGRRPVRLRVELVEIARFRILYGIQVLDEKIDTDVRETNPGLSALVSHRNLLGVGATASVLGRLRKDELFGRASLSFPRMFGLPIRTTLIGQQARRTIDRPGQFLIERVETLFQLQQLVDIGDSLSIGYAYNFERSSTDIPELGFSRPPAHVSRLIPTVVWDTRDNRLAPRRGLFHASTLELGLAALGSDFLFRKYSAQQYLFTPAGPFTLATAVRFGSGISLDEATDTLPSFERFLVGGATTVRGYPEDSLGRTPFFGSFLPGGDAMLVLNQEARFPIRGWIRGVVFADAGSTFTSLSAVRLSGLKASVGAGLRLATPYLTLRLDYGVRLSDVEGFDDLPRGRFHFGIGHIF